MTPRVVYLPAAERDIDLIAQYIAADNLEAALRFYEAVQDEARKIAAMPGLGALWFEAGDQLSDLRGCIISGFRKYIIFYRAVSDQIEVVRVLHGARDLKPAIRSEPR